MQTQVIHILPLDNSLKYVDLEAYKTIRSIDASVRKKCVWQMANFLEQDSMGEIPQDEVVELIITNLMESDFHVSD